MASIRTPAPGEHRRYCGLGSHSLRAPQRTVSDSKLLKFGKYLNPELRTTTPLCGACYDTLVQIYHQKKAHAFETRTKKHATNSISDVSYSQHLESSTTAKSCTLDGDDNDEPLLSLNAVNGTRLPHIQPIPKRRQFVHKNSKVMDIYLAGTTGG